MSRTEIEYPVEGYPDANDNGVPDAFENRLSITEVLNLPEKLEQITQANTALQEQVDRDNTLTLELDLRQRSPRKGEMYLFLDHVRVAMYDGGGTALIVKRIIAAPSWWRPEK